MNGTKYESPTLGLLTVLFIALKLLHKIAWGWVWVLAPTWVPLALILVGFVAILIAKAVSE